MNQLSIFLALVTLLATVQAKDRNTLPYKVVCYYEPGTVQPEQINAHICTHIIYAFGVMHDNIIHSADPERDEGELHDASTGQAMIRRIGELRKINPNLSILTGVGGWGEGSTKYSKMASTAQTRRIFINSVLEYLKKFNLDGLDFDWEFPGFPREGNSREIFLSLKSAQHDKANFAQLLKELKEAFLPHNYLLSAAVSGRTRQCDVAYDIPALNQHLDFINVMLYDGTGLWNGVAAHNAPLYETSRKAVDYWISKGADREKIIFGLPLYGYTFKLADGNKHNLGDAVDGDGHIGGNYGNICKVVRQPGWHVVFDETAKVPYAYNGSHWITYDNSLSIQTKLDYLKAKKLGGSMVWSMGLDDWKGDCGDGRFPLMKLQMMNLNKVHVIDNLRTVPEIYRDARAYSTPPRIYPSW